MFSQQTKMNSAENFLRSNAFRNSTEPTVDKPHDSASFSARLTHDRHLSAGINERFHNMTIDFAILKISVFQRENN